MPNAQKPARSLPLNRGNALSETLRSMTGFLGLEFLLALAGLVVLVLDLHWALRLAGGVLTLAVLFTALVWVRRRARGTLGDELGKLKAQQEADSAKLKTEIADLRDRVQRQHITKRFHRFSRRLSEEDERVLMEQWLPKLGLELRVEVLRYLESRICSVEDMLLGRLGGNIQNPVLRLLAALSLEEPELRILEIGTMSGSNACLMYDLLCCHRERVRLTLIDPLEGFYGKGNRDWATGLPVSPTVVRRNLHFLHVPEEDVTLIQKYSTDAAAVSAAGARTYHFIFVDGDHSQEGVGKDILLYKDMVEPGGIMAFDDYDNPDWPGVTPAVDAFDREDDRFERLGSFAETAVFRRVR
ncbi:MAG: class I SAM-dependent methyltransferase [Phycisphaerae bacterium]